MSPASAGSRVERIRTVVVLPAPLGPSSEKTAPSAMSRSIPSRTTVSPYAFRSPATAIAERVSNRVVMPCPSVVLRRGCAADADVAVGGAGAHLDGLLTRVGALRVGQLVVHAAEARVEVEPGRDARPDADVDLAEGGAGLDGARRGLAQTDVAVGGLERHGGAGLVDRDAAVGGVHAQVAGDVADPGLAVRALDHGRALDAVDADHAGPGRGVEVAGRVADAHVARTGADLDGSGGLDVEVAGAGLEPELAQPAGAAHGGDAGVALNRGSGRKRYAHVDRLAAAAGHPAPPAARAAHDEPVAGEVDPGLLGGGDVAGVGRIAWEHLDDGVGALGGLDGDVADAEVDVDGDGRGCLEGGHHGCPWVLVWFGSAGPAGVALGGLGRAARAGLLGVGAPQGGGGGPDEPGVHRQALLAGGALDRRLQPVGHAHVDAPERAVVVGRERRSRGVGARRRDRRNEPLREGARVLSPGLRGQEQVVTNVVDIRLEVHGIIMARV